MATSNRITDWDEDEPRIRDLLFRPIHGHPFNAFVHHFYITRLVEKKKQIQILIEELQEDLEILNYKKELYDKQQEEIEQHQKEIETQQKELQELKIEQETSEDDNQDKKEVTSAEQEHGKEHNKIH